MTSWRSCGGRWNGGRVRNRVLEFIDFWLGLLDRDRVKVFHRLADYGRVTLYRPEVVQPALAAPRAMTFFAPLGEPLIIGGWDDEHR